ncbi:hypothetical protein VTK73DRAFT_4592 [Phialemonium thermophilum]|uniref:Uncharacterized protein n=1 Tax=Phialemonium thermophilum TaxID=223376 RepID=A0ABR3XZP4_9PEZI
MPGHIEDDAVVGAELIAAAEDAERKSTVEARKSRHPDATPRDTETGFTHPLDGIQFPEGDKDVVSLGEGADDQPSEEDLHTLRRVSDHIPLKLFSIAFLEMCERFSYYGSVIVCMFSKLHSSLGMMYDAVSGALGMGQRVSTAITTFNQFYVYLTPLFGAYIADQVWGRYKTIFICLFVVIVGHIVLIMSAIPPVITKPSGNSLAALMVGILIIGLGTGGFKPNISPLIVEQLPLDHMRVRTLKTGERVIVDPAITINRVYNWFYLFINVGSLVGQLTMVYAEKYVGFYLSFLLPTCVLCIAPVVMLWGKKRYVHRPPAGSALAKAMRTWIYAQKGRWHLNPIATYRALHDGTFWDSVKPSRFSPGTKPKWMTFDDAWVDELARGFSACEVFLWYPVYWLTYNQINNNLVSQAAVMELNGVPNDVIANLDPIALIVLIPIFDFLIYPLFRRLKINFSPLKRITAGFFVGAAAMVWAAVVQAYIYWYSTCGSHASGTLPDGSRCPPVRINVWVQSGSYVLIAISEIFASITSLEYAFSKAPRNMRSMVQAVALFTTAVSAAVGEAFVSISQDPLLVWNYGSMAVLAFVAGCFFWVQFRRLDAEEDTLNELPEGRMFVDDEEIGASTDEKK